MASYRWAIVLGSIPILCLNSLQASTIQDPVLKIGLQIHNYAEVPAAILAPAKDETAGIFRRIGIEVVWSECALVGPGETSCSGIAADFVPPRPNFRIRILRQTLYPQESWKMGVTLKEALLANVFYDRVSDFTLRFLKTTGVVSARVLGSAIAHEIGHLLLPSNKVHSRTGIMRDQWTPRDFILNTMRFTDEEVRLMRTMLRGQAQ